MISVFRRGFVAAGASACTPIGSGTYYDSTGVGCSSVYVQRVRHTQCLAANVLRACVYAGRCCRRLAAAGGSQCCVAFLCLACPHACLPRPHEAVSPQEYPPAHRAAAEHTMARLLCADVDITPIPICVCVCKERGRRKE